MSVNDYQQHIREAEKTQASIEKLNSFNKKCEKRFIISQLKALLSIREALKEKGSDVFLRIALTEEVGEILSLSDTEAASLSSFISTESFKEITAALHILLFKEADHTFSRPDLTKALSHEMLVHREGQKFVIEQMKKISNLSEEEFALFLEALND